MFERAIERMKHSVFPIFFGNEEAIGISGTGFFIDQQGTFLTALHVLEDIPEGCIPLFAGNIPHTVAPASIIEVIDKSTDCDIALCRIPGFASKGVMFDLDRIGLGRNVCMVGYPFARVLKENNGEWNVKNVRQYWMPTFTVDEYFDDNFSPTQHIVYLDKPGLPGLSGGPIFALDGKVVAVNLGIMSRTTTAPHLPEVSLDNAIGIDVLSISDLLLKSEKLIHLALPRNKDQSSMPTGQ